jgi:uncharacterized protein YjiS (DUF1127 family)
MNAPIKALRFEREDARHSLSGDIATLVTSASPFVAACVESLEVPRRWEPEPERPAAAPRRSPLWRLLGALGRGLRPRRRLPYLSEHLCRDIGIEYRPRADRPFWTW